ncbi:putative F-box protein At3g16210 [Solanum dulcamara]|uniref:putative F-box protein At3g16210 n=1 Tax=Solanum dulcamara TaxID=45834 RepID=UPI00248563AC|nr:putative F-box protein At3g16210 [Solanum dulcamara]
MEHSMCFIPHDILFLILIMARVKSLLRFQCVSQSWKNLICDKVFRKAHHDKSKTSSSKKLLLVQTNDGVFEFRDLENPKILMRKQKFPLKRFQHVPALCSCDGLVLLKSHLAYKLYTLWNPYTNEYGIYECPYVKPYSGTTPHACGFCYDSDVDDYKVILIYRSFYAVFYVTRNSWGKRSSLHIQELNVRSWECSPGINIEGRVFWSIDWRIHHLVGQTSKIIYFDVKSDELKELPKPDFIDENTRLYRLTSFKGHIGLYGGLISSKTFDLWIMEQDEWRLSMTINCNIYCERFIMNSVLLAECTNHDEILFQIRKVQSQYSVIYNSEQHGFTKEIQMSKDLRHYIIPIFSECIYFPKLNIMRKRKQFS